MKKLLQKNQLLRTLAELRGNPRACVYTEPMWGLSMNLCLPYATVYMLAFRVKRCTGGDCYFNLYVFLR